MTLTLRQKNEIDYHREHAKAHAAILDKPFNWDVLDRPERRWWNAYWAMFTTLSNMDLLGKRVLVVGCGFGDDALRLARLGANVSACDLSPDSLAIARALADREGLRIDFGEMPAEAMTYPDRHFDVVIARDILHHVDIPATMAEIRRVAKPGAIFLADEIYSHSITERVRRSALVERVIYPLMRRWIYGTGKPYITQDERKLTEIDIRTIAEPLRSIESVKYFNFLVTRLIPDRYSLAARIDRVLLIVLRPFAGLLAGRILFWGHL